MLSHIVHLFLSFSPSPLSLSLFYTFFLLESSLSKDFIELQLKTFKLPRQNERFSPYFLLYITRAAFSNTETQICICLVLFFFALRAKGISAKEVSNKTRGLGILSARRSFHAALVKIHSPAEEKTTTRTTRDERRHRILQMRRALDIQASLAFNAAKSVGQ